VVKVDDIALLLSPARRGTTPLVQMAQVRRGTDGEVLRVVCFDGFTYFDRAMTGVVVHCSTTGAVHLDMKDCVDTSSFLIAVEGLLALRPRPSKTRGVKINDIALLLDPARRGTTPLVRMARVRRGTDGEVRRMVCLDGFMYFDRSMTSIVIRCSTTGAVHLDMVDYVDYLGFLLAVNGWLALGPRPSVFMADGGTNFKRGDSAVQDMAKKGQINLAKAQSHFDTKFRFAPPRAPRFRGLVEGFVGATKAAVHSAVHAHTFADEEFSAVFSRAMGRLNDVPVAYTVKSGADFHCLPLTLGHFLIGSAYAELQPIDTENAELTNATRYNRVCSVLEPFLGEISGRVDYAPRWLSFQDERSED
jgi:hypothetical protein